MKTQTALKNNSNPAETNRMPNGEAFPLPLILDILKRQIAISGGFLAILEAEKEALIQMDVNSLISLTRKKEQELTKIAQLDHSLQEVARRILAQEENKHQRIIKLAELIPFMTREQTLSVKKYRDQLASLREKISSNNLINKSFASATLGYINDAISLICGDIASTPLYSSHSRRSKSGSGPALVSREV
ncbi:MAG: flagellar protein FlgN [Pseudomonadota bacterium]